MMKTKLWIIIAVVVVILLSITFFLYSNGFLNSLLKKDSNTGTDTVLEDFDTFPVTSTSFIAAGKDKQWRMKLFQGFVNRYEEIDGNTVLILDVLSPDKNGFIETKVMLHISDENIPKALKYDKDGVSLSRFEKEYVKSVTFYPNVNKYKFGEPVLNEVSVEQFKTDFTKGTLLSFMAIVQMPTQESLTQKFCDDNGLYFCLLSELAYKYSGNLADFWDSQDDYQGIIVPFEKYLNGIEKLND